MSVFDSVTGTAHVELISADITGALHIINEMHIPIYDLQIIDELVVRFTIPRGNLKQVQAAARRKGDRVKVLSHKGIYRIMGILWHRQILLWGITALFCLTVFLPTRVMFVEVEGNQLLPNRLIQEAAKEAGISFFTSRRMVRSERMKNELLDALPQLQWAGVNTNGCVAVISVRERNMEEEKKEGPAISRIVAARDGVIASCTVTGGSSVCSIGQAVQKGQVLISGYTDCGGVIMGGRASGEIFAQTRHGISVVTPSQNEIRAQFEGDRTYYSLLVGKKRINFYKGSGISDSSCVKMVTQYDLRLPGGYVLPLALVKEQYMYYGLQSNSLDDHFLAARMSEFSRMLLRHSSVALEITDARETRDFTDGLIRMHGIYSCTEMIGREEVEQIGDFYGKTG